MLLQGLQTLICYFKVACGACSTHCGAVLEHCVPIPLQKIQDEGRIRYIHASTVVLGLVLPSIPTLLPLIDGYAIVPGLLLPVLEEIFSSHSSP